MLEQIKELRKQAMINKDKIARYAYETVVTECENEIGRSVGGSLTERKIIKIIKKEISKYNEIGREKDSEGELIPLKPGEVLERQKEFDLLNALLPEELPQLPDSDVVDILVNLNKSFKNPKEAFALLDQNYKDRYNKGTVAKWVLKK